MVINIQDDILKLHAMGLLDDLLVDRTTRQNIIWATDTYNSYGAGYGCREEITAKLITGANANIIKTRARKAMEQQSERTRQHAEVFSPFWICKKINDHSDEVWNGKNWMKYVNSRRLEITCGEAPYLVSRYDVETGEAVPIPERIGLLDRKLRAVNGHTQTEEKWLKWTIRAFWAIYGYDYQGDNVLISRVNLLIIIQEHYLLDFISYELRLPDKYITSFMNASFNQRRNGNNDAKQLDELHGGRYIARGTKEYNSNDLITYKDFSVNLLFDTYYRKIIDLCQKNNVAVRIIKLPLPSNTVYADDYEDSFYSYYESLKNDYPDITVDWFNNYEKEYFADSNHMNSHGALRFSTELKALYPDDFGNAELSSKQVQAINDSIKAENKIEEILKWICRKNYTVVVCDKRGSFQSIYNEEIALELGTERLGLSSVDLAQEENGTYIYYISGMNSSKQVFDVQLSENGVDILLTGGDSQEWKAVSDSALGVIVIDNYNVTAQ